MNLLEQKDFDDFHKRLSELHKELLDAQKRLKAAHPDINMRFWMEDSSCGKSLGWGKEPVLSEQERLEKERADLWNKKVSEMIAIFDGMEINYIKAVIEHVQAKISGNSFFVEKSRIDNCGRVYGFVYPNK